MKRVECVICILKKLAVIALLAAIEPNGNQSQKGEALANEKIGFTKKMQLIGKTAQHLRVDIPQAKQLTNITPPFLLPEEIKHKDGQNARVVEIYHCQQSYDITEQDCYTADQYSYP